MGITFNVTDDSHADHLDAKTLGVVREIMRDGESETLVSFPGFQIHAVTLPEHLAAVACALRGPTTDGARVLEDAVHYGTRGGRPNVSRLTRLPATTSRLVTVLVKQAEGEKDWTLVTAYGGPLAPQEPGDPFLAEENHASAVEFWGSHALSVDGSPDSTVTDGHTFALFSAKAEKEATA